MNETSRVDDKCSVPKTGRRDLLCGAIALATIAGTATKVFGQGPGSTDGGAPATSAVETSITPAGAAQSAEVTQLDDGFNVAPLAINQIGSAFRTYAFDLSNGDFSEQTSAVPLPPGAGFITLLNSLDYAFVRSPGSTTLTERPLGQFHVAVGMRGNNLVCRVRLTDTNADDPVRVRVTAGVLFWT